MFKKGTIKGFISGVCVTAVLTSGLAAFALKNQTINVATEGIKVYWDGVERELTNVNGDKVEPLLWEGSVYVPIRAMSNLAGKPVDWDGENYAVIVGNKPVAETTALKDMQDRIVGHVGLSTYYNGGVFTQKNTEFKFDNALRAVYSHSDKRSNAVTYTLEGQFSEFVADLASEYKETGANGSHYVHFYSVANDGEEYLIKKIEGERTDDPTKISVDLTGVVNLKIVIGNTAGYNNEFGTYLYNAHFLGR